MLYGYKIKKGKIEVDLEQAGVVRMIFEDYISGMGGSLIAKKIRRMKIPAFYGGAWNADCITEVIKNEKYTGNALLQKHYVKDHLSKLLISNRGALAKYYAQGTHPAIVDMAMFEKAQMIMENRRKKFKTKDNSHKRYPFSGLIRCENCGKNYKRRVCSGKAYWQCSTYLKKGKAFCHTKQIPEPILYEICADVLGLDCFDEDKFLEEIIEIKIPDFNHLVFAFCDGHTVEKVWKDRLRSESWDEAMRESTRQRTMERRSSK
jgi:hypothetical protein